MPLAHAAMSVIERQLPGGVGGGGRVAAGVNVGSAGSGGGDGGDGGNSGSVGSGGGVAAVGGDIMGVSSDGGSQRVNAHSARDNETHASSW